MSRARAMRGFLRSASLYMAVIKLFVVFFQLTLTLPRVFTRLSLRKDILSRTIYFETANLSFFDGCAAHLYGVFPAKAGRHLFLLRPYRHDFAKVCRYFLIRLQNFPLLQPVRHTRTAWQTKAKPKRWRSPSGGRAQAEAKPKQRRGSSGGEAQAAAELKQRRGSSGGGILSTSEKGFLRQIRRMAQSFCAMRHIDKKRKNPKIFNRNVRERWRIFCYI